MENGKSFFLFQPTNEDRKGKGQAGMPIPHGAENVTSNVYSLA